MKRLLLITVIALSLLNCETKKSSETTIEKDNKIVFGHKNVIHSDILKEDREIWIHLPESANDSTSNKTKYPVLYLLDGPAHFYSVTGMIKQLSTTNGNTIVPEMIIVAIPNTDRSRDLTPSHVNIDFMSGDSIPYSSGGGNKFLDFMEDELIPHIEKTYPATSYRTFVGHSFGGLSVINALINRQHLFNNYVAIDPSLWWDNQAFLNEADSLLSTNKFEDRALYVGVANTLTGGMTINEVQNDTTPSTIFTVHIKAILKFVKSVGAKEDNGLLFGSKYYENDDHGSVPLIAEYDAFRFLFSWHQLKGINQYYEQNFTSTADDLLQLIDAHYKNVSDHFGYEVLPPESLINSYGYGFLGESNKMHLSNALFKLNMQNYPNSSNVYDSMGDYHLADQDSIKALELFTKALEIGGNNTSQEKIDMLKKNLKIE